MRSEWIIGRTSECDIVVSDSSVSSKHCRLFRRGQQWILEDLNSSNGTFVNGVRINGPTPVSTTDWVVLGITGQLPWPDGMNSVDPAATLVKAPSAVPSSQTLSFPTQEIVVGRDASCDHVFDHPMVSRRHARLTRTRSGITVEDLGSSNGTFVNGQMITQATPINVGDVISLGSFELRLNLQGLIEQSDLRGKLSIEIRSLTVKVPGKTLLEDVSLTIQPGEFVGLMGPSGAGKTTLMSAMNGYVRPSSGEVLFNGESLYGNYSRFAIRMGYVPQDDIIHRDLTVGEALYYTAKLRLPDDYTKQDIDACVQKVVEQMGLTGVRDVLIGSAEKKGISGGQRKRVNLAMELLTEPLVLFLDEPTSGLSSEDALMVMKVLRSLADSGKTILLTIHQPSLEVFRLLDNLTVVSKDVGSSDPGRLTYYGPAYPGAVHFFNPDKQWPAGTDPSPDEVLRGMGKKPTREWLSRFNDSDLRRKAVANHPSAFIKKAGKNEEIETKTRSGGTITQWVTLTRRCFSIKARDTWNTLILLAQAPVVAVLIVMTFGKRAAQDGAKDLSTWIEVANTLPVSLFILVLSGLWFGCSNSVREIVGEWTIYRRERMVNLRIPSYVASKFFVLGLLSALQCLVLLLVVTYGCGLKGPFGLHYLSLLLVSLVGVGLGLLVSAATRTSEAAVALLPIALLPMVMLGGVMIPVHEMQNFIQPIANVMPSKWAYSASLETEGENQPRAPRPDIPGQPEPTEKAADITEKFFPEKDGRSGTRKALLVLLSMFLVLYVAVHVVLWKRDLH